MKAGGALGTRQQAFGTFERLFVVVEVLAPCEAPCAFNMRVHLEPFGQCGGGTCPIRDDDDGRVQEPGVACNVVMTGVRTVFPS